MKIRILLVMGTRPEAIKMAPLIRECQRPANNIVPIVCITGQHRELLAQSVDYFGIRADLHLDVMRPNQTLSKLTSRCLEGLDDAIVQQKPHYIVAQGDTTTVLAASIAAFYRRRPFVHVEAGLRTGDLYAPWPEEFNRRVPGITAELHCAPTEGAARNLLSEGVLPERVHVTGNTVIDALQWTVSRERSESEKWRERYPYLKDRRLVLITGHRRESFGAPFESVCQAIDVLSRRFETTEFLYPVHLNPNVREPVFRLLGHRHNIHLTEPVSYPEFVWLMDRSHLILTDSGGVQEEAPTLKKPVLVMRDRTERPEAVEAGATLLVGTNRNRIVEEAARLLEDAQAYAARQVDSNPYGDGHAAQRIVRLIVSHSEHHDFSATES